MSNTSTLSRRSFVAGALATAAAIAAAGAAGNVALADQKVYDSDAQGARDGGEMKWYITNPVAIEPFGAEENQGVQVMNCTYDTLTDYDWEKGEIVPLACESYESNDDATQFTFHLKKDLTFHNGKPVTAADYKYSWERICKPDFKPQPSSLAYKLNMIKGAKEMQAGQATEMEGIECPDDYTLVVNLTQPFSDFDGQVADYATAAVPAGSTDDEASFQAFRTHPVGNGPFKVDDNGWVDSQYVRVVRNDAYTGEKPHLDAITFVVYKDDQTAWTEFQAGNLDFTLLPSGQFTAAEATYGKADKDGYVANPGHQTLDGEETSIYYLIINNNDPVMSNKDLRIAMSYAINRQAICDTVLQGTKAPASDILAPGIPGHAENGWDNCPAEGDKDKAGEYFDKAGYPLNSQGRRDLTITLSTNNTTDNNNIMSMIQADLDACGVTASINTMEWAAYIDALQGGDYQCGRLGWTVQVPAPYMVLQPLFYTGSGDNNSQYTNPDFDKLIDEAGAITDQDERVKKYQEADRKLSDDFPVVPLFYYRHTYVASQRVNNLFLDARGYARMQRTWLSA